MRLFNPDNVVMTFEFANADGEKNLYKDKVILKIPNAPSPGGNTEVSMFAPGMEAKHYPLKYVENGKLHYELPDGVVLQQSIALDLEVMNKYTTEGVTFHPDGGIEQLQKDLVSAYGFWALNQSVALEISELKDNPIFKKAVDATRLGQRFCEWLHAYIEKHDYDWKGTMAATNLPPETIETLNKKELVGLPMSIVCSFADVFSVTLDAMVGILLQGGVLTFEEIQNGRDRAQKEISGNVSGSRIIPPEPGPLA